MNTHIDEFANELNELFIHAGYRDISTDPRRGSATRSIPPPSIASLLHPDPDPHPASGVSGTLFVTVMAQMVSTDHVGVWWE